MQRSCNAAHVRARCKALAKQHTSVHDKNAIPVCIPPRVPCAKHRNAVQVRNRNSKLFEFFTLPCSNTLLCSIQMPFLCVHPTPRAPALSITALSITMPCRIEIGTVNCLSFLHCQAVTHSCSRFRRPSCVCTWCAPALTITMPCRIETGTGTEIETERGIERGIGIGEGMQARGRGRGKGREIGTRTRNVPPADAGLNVAGAQAGARGKHCVGLSCCVGQLFVCVHCSVRCV